MWTIVITVRREENYTFVVCSRSKTVKKRKKTQRCCGVLVVGSDQKNIFIFSAECSARTKQKTLSILSKMITDTYPKKNGLYTSAELKTPARVVVININRSNRLRLFYFPTLFSYFLICVNIPPKMKHSRV